MWLEGQALAQQGEGTSDSLYGIVFWGVVAILIIYALYRRHKENERKEQLRASAQRFAAALREDSKNWSENDAAFGLFPFLRDDASRVVRKPGQSSYQDWHQADRLIASLDPEWQQAAAERWARLPPSRQTTPEFVNLANSIAAQAKSTSAHGVGAGAPSPGPNPIKDWKHAENRAAVWLRRHIDPTAVTTGSGADGGVDIVGNNVVAQVKWWDKPVPAAEVQRTYGIAQAHGKDAFFFARGVRGRTRDAYSAEAIAFAGNGRVTLLGIDPGGNVWRVSPKG